MPYIINRDGFIEKESALQENSASVRSSAVSDIMSYKPGFLIRYGNFIFLLVLVVAAIISWLIRYPDIVSGKAVLMSVNLPKPVITRIDGRITRLGVRENQPVRKGDILGYMESAAAPGEILRLSLYLDTLLLLLDAGNEKVLIKQRNTSFTGLGELQPYFQTFTQSFFIFSNYVEGGFFDGRPASPISGKTSPVRQETALTAQQKNLRQGSAIFTNRNKLSDKDREIIELRNESIQQRIVFLQAIYTMISRVDEWKKKYLLIAPADGKILLSGFWQTNQSVKAGQTICYVSSGDNSYYAQMIVPQFNFGKVRVGEKVLLKFQAYPNAEWGSVAGHISFISRVVSDSGYLATVSLSNGLLTDYNKEVQYQDGLTATGEIIISDKRLLEKLYYSIYEQLSR